MKQILEYPDPRLRLKAEPIGEITEEIKARAREMFYLMDQYGGIGLAAPQIGWGVRLFIVNVTGGAEDNLVLINPEVLEKGGGSWVQEEGCLSFPGFTGKVKREKNVLVRATSLEGKQYDVQADGLVGRCILHEMDHLDGVLLIDRFSPAKKQSIKGKLKGL